MEATATAAANTPRIPPRSQRLNFSQHGFSSASISIRYESITTLTNLCRRSAPYLSRHQFVHHLPNRCTRQTTKILANCILQCHHHLNLNNAVATWRLRVLFVSYISAKLQMMFVLVRSIGFPLVEFPQYFYVFAD